MITRFKVIPQTLACGFAINAEAYGAYAYKTAKLYVVKFGWYYMPVSVHKILLHGAVIISNFVLPIGQLSEEAQESRNKAYKQFRKSHTRKFSRTVTNTEELMNIMLVLSDLGKIDEFMKVSNF